MNARPTDAQEQELLFFLLRLREVLQAAGYDAEIDSEENEPTLQVYDDATEDYINLSGGFIAVEV